MPANAQWVMLNRDRPPGGVKLRPRVCQLCLKLCIAPCAYFTRSSALGRLRHVLLGGSISPAGSPPSRPMISHEIAMTSCQTIMSCDPQDVGQS